MRPSIEFFVAASWLGLTASFVSAADEEVEDAKVLVSRNRMIQQILIADNSYDLRERVHLLMQPAKPRQLRKFKTHSHHTISLHVAWEEVKRTTLPVRTPIDLVDLEEEEKEHVILKFDRRGIERFMGFLEGRLEVIPPLWWQAKLLRVKTFEHNLSYLLIPGKSDDGPYWQAEKGDIQILDTLDGKRRADGDYLVNMGTNSCVIPALYMKKELTPDNGNLKDMLDRIGLTAWMDRDRCVFGFHNWITGGFKLHCINRTTLKPIWSTDVWGYHYGAFAGGGGWLWAEMRTKGDELILFGMTHDYAFIEGVSLKDGTHLFHFTTNYSALD